MEGAREYAGLFKTGQYGKLYIVSGSHARGVTFRIQILPEGETAEPNGEGNSCLNDNAIEVYGVVAGHRGWTERYGWLEKGKWVHDFEDLVANKRQVVTAMNDKRIRVMRKTTRERQKVKESLLSDY